MEFAVVLFLCIPVVPFLGVNNKTKISISTTLFILGEIAFWGGGILVGKELLSTYKSYLNPKNWLNEKIDSNEIPDMFY